jgi:hypothetical protein
LNVANQIAVVQQNDFGRPGGIIVAELNVREWYAYNTKRDANKCFSLSFANKEEKLKD